MASNENRATDSSGKVNLLFLPTFREPTLQTLRITVTITMKINFTLKTRLKCVVLKCLILF